MTRLLEVIWWSSERFRLHYGAAEAEHVPLVIFDPRPIFGILEVWQKDTCDPLETLYKAQRSLQSAVWLILFIQFIVYKHTFNSSLQPQNLDFTWCYKTEMFLTHFPQLSLQKHHAVVLLRRYCYWRQAKSHHHLYTSIVGGGVEWGQQQNTVKIKPQKPCTFIFCQVCTSAPIYSHPDLSLKSIFACPSGTGDVTSKEGINLQPSSLPTLASLVAMPSIVSLMNYSKLHTYCIFPLNLPLWKETTS